MKKSRCLLLLAVLTSACAIGQPSPKADPNTIQLTKDGKTYRLTAVGDKVPAFYVDGRLVDKGDFERYEPLLTHLQQQLEQRRDALAQKVQLLTEVSRANLVADLIRDKFIGSEAELISFKLDQNNFVINGQKQSFAAYTRYKGKYLTGSTCLIQFN